MDYNFILSNCLSRYSAKDDWPRPKKPTDELQQIVYDHCLEHTSQNKYGTIKENIRKLVDCSLLHMGEMTNIPLLPKHLKD